MVHGQRFDQGIDNKRGVITVPSDTKRIVIQLHELSAQVDN
jgi:hypothetical protein